MRTLIYNADGVNPYATEIAALLVGRGADVVLIDAANGEHRPPEPVRWHRALPANFGDAGPGRQLMGMVRGLLAVVRGALFERRTVVVAFTRFSVEHLVLGLLAGVGCRVVVVLHNPVSRRKESPALPITRRFLLGRAAHVVIHAERLRDDVERAAASRIAVCPHPPYAHTALPDAPPSDGTIGGAAPVDRRWVAFVGALRWDKGSDLLPDILARVPESERRRIGVVVCGRGSLPDGSWDRLRALGYEVRDLTSSAPIPQEQLLAVLAQRPLVLAPYVAATQSGTVILALTMGCRVVAFDEGGIPDVVTTEGLVPSGDLDAMAQAIAEDRGGGGIMPLEAWIEEAAERWWATISDGRPARRSALDSSRWHTLARRVPALARSHPHTRSRMLVRLDRHWRAGRSVRFAELVDTVLRMRPDVVSLDVFDTLLTRRVLGAEDVWWITGSRLADTAGGPEDPTLPRRYLEARRRAAHEDPAATLEVLVRHPAVASLGLERADRVEAEVDASLVRAIPGTREGLQHLRAAGIPLVFLTDMHLPRTVLDRMLRGNGLLTDADELIISSELGSAKSTGALFVTLRPTERRVVHIGNDLWSDVASAEASGVRGLAITSAEPTRSEATMGRRPGSQGTAVAAAARWARLSHEPRGAADAALINTGAVVGQCFGAFLLWVRETCASEAITDVGFLARDGVLPYRMAQAMPPDHWAGTDLRYVELASRRAWSVAAAATLGIEDWIRIGNADDRAFINTSRHLVPFYSLLERIALAADDLREHPELAALDPARPLPTDRVEAWSSLLADTRIHATILSRAERQLTLLIDYLRSLELADRRLALVDVGWRGQLAWMMSAVLREVTGAEPLHLHFGGANVARGLSGSVDIRRFAVDDTVDPLPFHDMVSCVETFTASGDRRALGLERSAEGTIELVYGGGVPDVANEARQRMWAVALGTAAALPTHEELRTWRLDTSSLGVEVREVLTEVWTDPEPEHAAAAAQLSFEVDEAGTVVGPVAAPYQWREFVGQRHLVPRQWRHGSLRLTPPIRRSVVQLTLWARTAIERALRRS